MTNGMGPQPDDWESKSLASCVTFQNLIADSCVRFRHLCLADTALGCHIAQMGRHHRCLSDVCDVGPCGPQMGFIDDV